jgi:antitoxin MazE
MELEMQVSKWGDSLAVRLPKELVEKLDLHPGDELKIVEAAKYQLCVEKIDKRKKFMEMMEQFRWPAPEGYKLDRDEANERWNHHLTPR